MVLCIPCMGGKCCVSGMHGAYEYKHFKKEALVNIPDRWAR